MTASEVKALLLTLAEPGYQEFFAGLIPGAKNIMGVKTSHLHRIAKKIAKEDWRAYLAEPEGTMYKEGLLRGLVIGYAKAEPEELFPYITAHVETITSWSACDTFCSRLKVAQRSPELVWAFVKPYYQRVDAYPLRFAIVMTLNYYLNDEYIDEVLALLDAVHHEDYYVRMAVAWALSMAYLSHPEKTMRLLENSTQDDWTYNKTLRKIIESRHVDDAA